MVVVDSPNLDSPASVGHSEKPVEIEAFVPRSPVEALDQTVLDRFLWADENERDTALMGPLIERLAGAFGTGPRTSAATTSEPTRSLTRSRSNSAREAVAEPARLPCGVLASN